MDLIAGSCLCGNVTFQCENTFKVFHLCHCNQCQKISGAAHVANLFTSPDNIQWLSGEHLIKHFDVPGRQISNAFCTNCGTHVPYLSGNSLIVPAGSLDGIPNCQADDHIFWSERAEWYEAAVTAKKYQRFPEE